MIIMSITAFKDLSMYKRRAEHYLNFREYLEDIPLNTCDDVFGTVIFLKIPEAEGVIKSSEEMKRVISTMLTQRLQLLIAQGKYDTAREISEILEKLSEIDRLEEVFKTVSVAYVLALVNNQDVDLDVDLKSSALDLLEAEESLFLQSVPFLEDLGDLGKLLDNLRFDVESLKSRIRRIRNKAD